MLWFSVCVPPLQAAKLVQEESNEGHEGLPRRAGQGRGREGETDGHRGHDKGLLIIERRRVRRNGRTGMQ